MCVCVCVCVCVFLFLRGGGKAVGSEPRGMLGGWAGAGWEGKKAPGQVPVR